MIDWEWLKSINAFQGCVGQFMGFIGMVVGMAGTYLITNINYTRENKKEQSEKLEKRKISLNIILNEIKNNNALLMYIKYEKVFCNWALLTDEWNTYRNNIINKQDYLTQYLLYYYRMIDILKRIESSSEETDNFKEIINYTIKCGDLLVNFILLEIDYKRLKITAEQKEELIKRFKNI